MSNPLAELIGDAHAFEDLDEFRHGISGQALGLTRRQAEALRWVALGPRGADIARLMGLSPRTVEKHLQGVYARLGVENSSQAAATAGSAVGARLSEA